MESMSDKNRKLKILIMSAPIGSGHRMAARALEEALLRLDNVEVVQGNVFTFFPSWLGKAFLGFYGKVLAFCPSLYALTYRWSNGGDGSLWMRNLLNSALLRLGRTFIEEVKPDLVFSTHATPTGIFSLYKQKYNPKLWLGVVVTDFTVHRWLVCPGVDAYFTADEKLFGQIRAAAGLCAEKHERTDDKDRSSQTPSGNEAKRSQTETEKPSEVLPKLFAYGIPVRSAFSEQRELAKVREEVRDAFGWPADVFVCLLAGGGGGMLPMAEIVDSLCNKKFENIRVAAVAGHNEALYKKLSARQKDFLRKRSGKADGDFAATDAGVRNGSSQTKDKKGFEVVSDAKGPSRLAVLGFTDAMPQLMQAADMVITKAGGISLAECLACGANVVIYSPLPGQEQANTAFVQKEYGVAAVEDIRQLHKYLEKEMSVPLADRLQRQEMRRQRCGHPDASGQIAGFIERLQNG
jgi:processive 1,2-diacylglycerol beta-glucosyltransferase